MCASRLRPPEDFDERTEIVREDEAVDADELTMRGDMLIEAGFVDPVVDPGPTAQPPAAAPPPRRRRLAPLVLALAVAIVGGGIGILAAMLVG